LYILRLDFRRTLVETRQDKTLCITSSLLVTRRVTTVDWFPDIYISIGPRAISSSRAHDVPMGVTAT
jgi:hypothetical protein